MAAAYSMDLRERVFKAWQASGDADDVAATFGVSRAWVHRLAQRHREARCDAGGAPGAIADDGRAEYVVGRARSPRLDGQKKRYTPPNSAARTSPLSGDGGATRSRFTTRGRLSSSTNRA